MNSEIRSKLKDYIGKDGVFIASVHHYNTFRKHLILNDVRIFDGNGLLEIASHVHVHNCNYKGNLIKFDIIVFEATVYSYNRGNADFNNYNFALEDVRNIKVVEGEYYE